MPVIAVGSSGKPNKNKKVGTWKGGRQANQERVKSNREGAWKKELLKIKPQKKRAKGVTREQHRKWKDEQKAKHRAKVRSKFGNKK